MAKSAGDPYTIAVDFDGVIHSYMSDWVSAEVIPDPPVDGVIDWLNRMAVKFTIVVFTTRGATVEGRDAVMDYLHLHGFRDDVEVEVTDQKPPALVYIDDRAYRFTGANFPTVEEVHRLRPWNKGAPAAEPDLQPKREVIRDCLNANPHSPASPDAILNALHQAGWAVVPRG